VEESGGVDDVLAGRGMKRTRRHKGCVPVDGDTYDLPMRIATVHKSGNKKLAEVDKRRFGDEKKQKELSSVTYIARGKHIPPFLILHVADRPDTRGQSQRLFQVLQQAGVPAQIHPAEGKNHTTINNDLGVPGEKPTRALFAFLNEVLKKPGEPTKVGQIKITAGKAPDCT
jgi:arylformamidase